jgi:cytochrome c oxidase accessory protein FixG
MTPPLDTKRVLSTLHADGTRRWIEPRLARGRFLRRRRIVGWALIALFVALPFVRIGGRPALLIDLVAREVSLFGGLFRPTDGFMLMLLGLTIVITVFLVTALFGRVWCGWGCPQTVYLELVYRPIERLAKGRPVVKWAAFAVLSFLLANVFLAYFVGTDRLARWVLSPPGEHLGGFLTVVGVAALVLFDFGYFREQTCILACPYGRLQSVLIDRQSLIVGYDARRGEPRGKPKKKLPVLQDRGDCVDCGACVQVCPTGIDIRDGLQMECIGCAQCIDACDTVMDRLHKPHGLIGYTSKEELDGAKRRLLRPRTLVYPALLAIAGAMLIMSVGSKESTNVTVERVTGPAFVELPDGMISAQARIKLENEGDESRRYTIAVVGSPAATLRSSRVWNVEPRRSIEVPLFVDTPRERFREGRRDVHLQITSTDGFHRVVTVTLLGPEGAP